MQQCHAGIAIGANFKMYLLHQFCSNRVEFFLQYTGDTDAKNDGSEFCNSNSVIFLEFFEIFKKASRGPSAADLDHYGRDKLDHSRVLVTKFLSKSVNVEG